MQPQTVENVLGRSWRLLTTNWSIVVPGLVIGALSGVIVFLVTPDLEASFARTFLARVVTAVVQILATILSIAYTTGMAAAAWQRGTATFADGKRAFERDAGHVFVAMIGLFVLGILAALLAPFTLLLSLLAYMFFCIYTMAAAVVGERRGFAAIAESAQIAYRRALPTLSIVLAILGIALVMGIVAGLLSFAPLIGPIVAAVVLQGVVAYAALVVVGEYLALRGADTAA